MAQSLLIELADRIERRRYYLDHRTGQSFVDLTITVDERNQVIKALRITEALLSFMGQQS